MEFQPKKKRENINYHQTRKIIVKGTLMDALQTKRKLIHVQGRKCRNK